MTIMRSPLPPPLNASLIQVSPPPQDTSESTSLQSAQSDLPTSPTSTIASSRLHQLTRTLQRSKSTMSTTSQSHNPQPAPWRSAFLSHISQMDSPEFVLSTLHPAPQTAASGSTSSTTPSAQPSPPTAWLPRARFCIFRGLWAELPENKHNTAPRNPGAYESDLPTLTTDVRMHKAAEAFASSAGRADDERFVKGSGGGGPCEAVWWAKAAMVQWRIKGEAFVVGPDIEDESGGEESSGVRTVKSEVGRRMRVVDEKTKAKWSWGRELTAHFGNMSPGMRGSFAAPPPGQPVDQPYDDEKLKLGTKIEDLEDETARSHFRVVIIRPQEVESVDLSDPSTARRQLYMYDDATGEWTHQECWP